MLYINSSIVQILVLLFGMHGVPVKQFSLMKSVYLLGSVNRMRSCIDFTTSRLLKRKK